MLLLHYCPNSQSIMASASSAYNQQFQMFDWTSLSTIEFGLQMSSIDMIKVRIFWVAPVVKKQEPDRSCLLVGQFNLFLCRLVLSHTWIFMISSRNLSLISLYRNAIGRYCSSIIWPDLYFCFLPMTLPSLLNKLNSTAVADDGRSVLSTGPTLFSGPRHVS